MLSTLGLDILVVLVLLCSATQTSAVETMRLPLQYQHVELEANGDYGNDYDFLPLRPFLELADTRDEDKFTFSDSLVQYTSAWDDNYRSHRPIEIHSILGNPYIQYVNEDSETEAQLPIAIVKRGSSQWQLQQNSNMSALGLSSGSRRSVATVGVTIALVACFTL
jgi:hypothetical protein